MESLPALGSFKKKFQIYSMTNVSIYVLHYCRNYKITSFTFLANILLLKSLNAAAGKEGCKIWTKQRIWIY